MTRHPRIRFTMYLLLLSLPAGGCGGSRGTVSGKVKYKGRPLPAGQVVFFDDKDRRIASASVGSDGSYSAILPGGNLRIAIITPIAPPSQAMSSAEKERIREMARKKYGDDYVKYTSSIGGESDDAPPQKFIPVPPKYADPANSGLSLTVIGGPQSFDIDVQ